jgi:hypothetical protein
MTMSTDWNDIPTCPTLQWATHARQRRLMWRATDSMGHVMGYYLDRDAALRAMRSPEAGEWRDRRP